MDLLLQYALVNDAEEMAFLNDEEDARMLVATLVAEAILEALSHR
jgi:hypothetical protein